MVRKRKKPTQKLDSYDHLDKERANNPEVGLVNSKTDPEGEKKMYEHDPHIDPHMSWSGKAENTSFEVPKVSLHVHERIDSQTIISSVSKKNEQNQVMSFFDSEKENPPLRKAIEFYKHIQNWSNRLIAGDSLLVMNSLLEKEGLGGQVQTIFIDPPYGIKYRSNFQPNIGDRKVGDQDKDLTTEPEQICAFRDTWEMGIHSYLGYLRDRLLLARRLLNDSGSCFVQIGDENVHRVGVLLDEVFGAENRLATISFATSGSSSSKTLPEVCDYLLWYGKNKKVTKYNQLYEKLSRSEVVKLMNWDAMVELEDGRCRALTKKEKVDPNNELPPSAKLYRRVSLVSQGHSSTGRSNPYNVADKVFHCLDDEQWSISKEGLDRLHEKMRLDLSGNQQRLCWKKYEDEFPGKKLNNIWKDLAQAQGKRYVVQTADKIVQRCILMTSDPGDLVFDPTCGSGTFAHIAEKWGRRWITCDTSRVAIAIARQRIMTSTYDYYELMHPDEGVGSGIRVKSVNYVSAKTLAYDEPVTKTYLYDQPIIEKSKMRVSGPFTVEAVPSPVVIPLDNKPNEEALPADNSVARSGETVRQDEWRNELLKTGIRGKSGQKIEFTRLEPMQGTRWIHSDGETRIISSDTPPPEEFSPEFARTVVSFGPAYGPLDQRQVERVIEESQTLVPKPKIIVFAAFQFDPEAAKNIDETKWPETTLLKAQMNADLLTDDLKKNRSSNESFWLIGQPEVKIEKMSDEHGPSSFQVTVKGYDYFNTATGQLESGDSNKIALWMLDTDYDGRSLYPRQIFFPQGGGKKHDLRKLEKALNSIINPDLINQYFGTVSLPFKAGENRRIAVKIIDDRGVESLKIVNL